jgi:hypothetical protein
MLDQGKTALVSALVLVASVGGAEPGQGRARVTWPLTIRIYDQSSVPVASLARAQATAGYVFDAIGVETTWLQCKSGGDDRAECDAPPPRPRSSS